MQSLRVELLNVECNKKGEGRGEVAPQIIALDPPVVLVDG